MIQVVGNIGWSVIVLQFWMFYLQMAFNVIQNPHFELFHVVFHLVQCGDFVTKCVCICALALEFKQFRNIFNLLDPQVVRCNQQQF